MYMITIRPTTVNINSCFGTGIVLLFVLKSVPRRSTIRPKTQKANKSVFITVNFAAFWMQFLSMSENR